MFRQYELSDCAVIAVKGQELLIVEGFAPYGITESYGAIQRDIVSAFVDPKTRDWIFVPYGSKIDVLGKVYFVKKGEPITDANDSRVADSPICLYRNHVTYSMNSLYDKPATVVSLPRIRKRDRFVDLVKNLYNQISKN